MLEFEEPAEDYRNVFDGLPILSNSYVPQVSIIADVVFGTHDTIIG